MALPKPQTLPKWHKLKLPSDGRTVNYRPFLVKEEKLLLVATETGEQSEIIDAIKDIIKNCTDLDNVDNLATFDIEYLFLQIRTKSVGEEVEVLVNCPDDKTTQVKAKIPLDQIKVKKTRGHKTTIQLTDECAVEMDTSKSGYVCDYELYSQQITVDDVFKMAAACVKAIQDPNQVYECKDIPQDEILAFFDDMNSAQFQRFKTSLTLCLS